MTWWAMTWACDVEPRSGPGRTAGAGGEVPPLSAAALTAPETLERGRSLFGHQCAVCHGAGGRGDGPRAFRLASRPADLTATAWQVGLTPEDVYRQIRDGVPGTDMPAWRALRPEDLAALTAFVLSLDGSAGVTTGRGAAGAGEAAP